MDFTAEGVATLWRLVGEDPKMAFTVIFFVVALLVVAVELKNSIASAWEQYLKAEAAKEEENAKAAEKEEENAKAAKKKEEKKPVVTLNRATAPRNRKKKRNRKDGEPPAPRPSLAARLASAPVAWVRAIKDPMVQAARAALSTCAALLLTLLSVVGACHAFLHILVPGAASLSTMVQPLVSHPETLFLNTLLSFYLATTAYVTLKLVAEIFKVLSPWLHQVFDFNARDPTPEEKRAWVNTLKLKPSAGRPYRDAIAATIAAAVESSSGGALVVYDGEPSATIGGATEASADAAGEGAARSGAAGSDGKNTDKPRKAEGRDAKVAGAPGKAKNGSVGKLVRNNGRKPSGAKANSSNKKSASPDAASDKPVAAASSSDIKKDYRCKYTDDDDVRVDAAASLVLVTLSAALMSEMTAVSLSGRRGERDMETETPAIATKTVQATGHHHASVSTCSNTTDDTTVVQDTGRYASLSTATMGRDAALSVFSVLDDSITLTLSAEAAVDGSVLDGASLIEKFCESTALLMKQLVEVQAKMDSMASDLKRLQAQALETPDARVVRLEAQVHSLMAALALHEKEEKKAGNVISVSSVSAA